MRAPVELEEAVACMAIAILHLGAVEGGEDGREEGGLEAEVWLADAIEESSGVVALASRVSTELRGKDHKSRSGPQPSLLMGRAYTCAALARRRRRSKKA